MVIKNKTINIGNYMFYLPYALIIATRYLSQYTVISKYSNYITLASAAIMLLHLTINLKKIKAKRLIVITLIVVISFIAYLTSANTQGEKEISILITILIIIAAHNQDVESFIRKDFLIRIISTALVITLCMIGQIKDITILRDSSSLVRHSIGFAHPNQLGLIIAIIVLEWLYIKRHSLKWYHIIVSLSAVIIILIITDSRSSAAIIFITALLLPLSMRAQKRGYKLTKTLQIIIQNSYIFFLGITLLFTALYGAKNDIAIQLNDLLSNRIYYQETYMDSYPISLFGNELHFRNTTKAKETQQEPRILDNSYIYILLRFGLLMTLLYAYLYRKTFQNLIKENNLIAILYLIIFLAYGLSEQYVLSIYYSAFIIMLSKGLYAEHAKIETNEKKSLNLSNSSNI